MGRRIKIVVSDEERAALLKQDVPHVIILVQGVTGALLGGKDGFDKALQVIRKLHQSKRNPKRQVSALINALRAGNAGAWYNLFSAVDEHNQTELRQVLKKIQMVCYERSASGRKKRRKRATIAH